MVWAYFTSPTSAIGAAGYVLDWPHWNADWDSWAISIGWDNKLISGTAAQQHFYDKEGSSLKKSDFIHSNEVAQNPSAVQSLEREGKVSTNAILPWYNWLKSKGAELKIISDINPAPEEIKRVQI